MNSRFQTRILALLFVLFAGFLVTSCAPDSPVDASEGHHSPQADINAYGQCETCELPPSTSGSLPTVLMANDNFLNVMQHCYEETPADVCRSGQGVYMPSSLANSTTLYVAGALWTGNVLSHHCSFLYQLGNAALSARPSGQWLLHEVRDIVHLGSGHFRVYLTWNKYRCGEVGNPQLPQLN